MTSNRKRGAPVDVVQVGFESQEKPILLRIVPKVGYPIDGVRINYDVPAIHGFLAIESPDVKHATMYIALDNIASFTVLDEESFNIRAAFPKHEVKVEQR